MIGYGYRNFGAFPWMNIPRITRIRCFPDWYLGAEDLFELFKNEPLITVQALIEYELMAVETTTLASPCMEFHQWSGN
jgi:hypothetical protein